MTSVPDEWQEYTILGSGSHEFLRLIMPKLRHHVGPFIFANDMAFTGRRCSKVNRLHRSWAAHDYRMGLESTTVRHADFGGITSAVHGISFRGVDISIFTPSAPLPRTLRHVLSDTTPDATQEISAPTPLTDPQPRVPVYIDGMMRRKGLFDIGKPTAPIACPCVFKPTGWGCRRLSAKELLRAFDVSPLDNAVLLTHRRAQTLLQRSITPLVVTTICRNLWNTGGGYGGAGTKQDEVLPSNDEGMAGRTSYKKGDSGRKDNNKEENKDKKNIGEKHKEEDVKDEEDTEVEEEKLTQDQELLRAIKKAHNLTKAVKSDDAEVPKHLWDAAVCRGPPSPNQARALAVLRVFMLRIYRKRLWQEIRAYMQHTHGPDWITKMRDTKMQINLVEEVEGMRDILWRATENGWFQCPVGSRLLFFRFPPRYRKQALRGVRIMFTDKGPESLRRQPPLQPDEKQVLRKKVKKFLERKYEAPYRGKIRSLIKYFAVPKGIIDNVVQDWRTVFHAGANKLNDAVWVPSFGLPTVNLLLRITDLTSLMEDRDVKEMFLNFQLHPDTIKFTGIDIGPLEFTFDECEVRWVCWNRNLMGFRPSPYNSI